MFLSMNWIGDFVDLSGLDKKALIRNFTLSTAEVEDIFVKGEDTHGVIVAKIISVENHPTSKKLHLLKVDTGSEVLDIVCGAPNVRVGMKVALATSGGAVCGHPISPATVAGFTSYGMCCSEAELGISDDNSGIWEITDDIALGTDIKSVYGIDDIIFEVDNKSLTNRPDLWSHYGIAREFATITGRELKPIPVYDVSEFDNLPSVAVDVKGNPNGEAFVRLEQPRGEAVFYFRGDGTQFLNRARVRTPTFANIPSLVKILEGCDFADVPILVLTIDPCVSCTER